jgi:hypothetical protein
MVSKLICRSRGQRCAIQVNSVYSTRRVIIGNRFQLRLLKLILIFHCRNDERAQHSLGITLNLAICICWVN